MALYTYREAMNIINKGRKKQVNIQDIRNAMAVMNKKHSSCEWIIKDDLKRYVETEGVMWLQQVYFREENSLLYSDVLFFENLVQDYENFCKSENVEYQIPPLIECNMTFDEFAKFVGYKKQSVQKAFYKLSEGEKGFCYYCNGKKYLMKVALRDLCQKYFKKTYLKYLENVYNYFWNNCLNRFCIYPEIDK